MSFASRVNKERPFSMAWGFGNKNEPVEDRELKGKNEPMDEKIKEVYNPPVISTKLELPEKQRDVKPKSKEEIRAYFNALKEAGEDLSILPVPAFLEDEEPELQRPDISKEQLEFQRKGQEQIDRLLDAKTEEEKKAIMEERKEQMKQFKVAKRKEETFLMPLKFQDYINLSSTH